MIILYFHIYMDNRENSTYSRSGTRVASSPKHKNSHNLVVLKILIFIFFNSYVLKIFKDNKKIEVNFVVNSPFNYWSWYGCTRKHFCIWRPLYSFWTPLLLYSFTPFGPFWTPLLLLGLSLLYIERTMLKYVLNAFRTKHYLQKQSF